MLLVLALAGYLILWPVPIKAFSWQAPQAPGYVGMHAPNTRLVALHQLSLQGEVGPEHIVAHSDGKLYTAVASGKILRVNPDDSSITTIAQTGGRPLGLAFDADNNLIVADANKGLLSITPGGEVSTLSNTVAGDPIRFANSVAVAGSGKVYFSDASTRFSPAQWGGTLQAATLDVFEQSCTGRLLEYHPAARTTRIVAKGLCFPNGVALSGDEQTAFVAESAKYRVWRIAVGADRLDVREGSPQAKVLLDNLPGYPDNLTRGRNGKLWLGLAGQRNELDTIASRPFLREMALRIPRALWAMPPAYGHVIAFTEDGAIVDDLQDPSGASPLITGLTETADRLYIHNVSGHSLGWKDQTAAQRQ